MRWTILLGALALASCGQYLAEREYAEAEESGATSAKLCRMATKIADEYDGADADAHTKWAATAASQCLRASIG